MDKRQINRAREQGIVVLGDLAVLRTGFALADGAEELGFLQQAVAAARTYVPRNMLQISITVALLQFRDGLAHIDQSLDKGSVTEYQAHRQKNGLAEVCAAHITDLVCEQVQRPTHDTVDRGHRYLVQLRKEGWEYFRTDCSFRNGQLHLARAYVRAVVDSLGDVMGGRVLHASTHDVAYQYP